MITLSGGEGIPFPEAQLPELLGLVDASVGAVISAVFAELSAGTEPASASVDGMIDVCVHLVCLYPHPVRQRTVLWPRFVLQGILEKLQAAAAEAEEGGEASAEPTEVITAEEPTEGAPAAEEAPVPQNAVVTADEPAPASDEPVVPVEEAVVSIY